jgi:hypothetical protein
MMLCHWMKGFRVSNESGALKMLRIARRASQRCDIGAESSKARL